MATLSSLLKLRVRPHWGQLQVLRSQTFCTAAIAGTGGGKTVNGVVWLLLQMVTHPGQSWVVCEPTLDMVERILFTSSPGRMSLVDVLGKFDPEQVFLRSKGILRHRLGTVFFVSAERPEALQGAHVGGVWLDEGGLMKREAWLVALQRVGYARGKILITTTPYNMGWLKSLVYDPWRAGDKDYTVIQFPSTANPRFPPEAMERARRSMSPTRFRMLYEGEFGRPEGMVYDVYEPGKHLVDDFSVPAEWQRLGGVDFGFNNPTAGVFLARDPDGVYYWYAEHYQREATLAVHAAALKGQDNVPLWYGDPSAKQQMLELRRLGVNVVPGDNDVNAGIDTVYSLFAAGRLKVFRSLKWAVDELESYVWEKGQDGFKDRPLKENDHLMDALRYALHSHEKRPGLRLVT